MVGFGRVRWASRGGIGGGGVVAGGERWAGVGGAGRTGPYSADQALDRDSLLNWVVACIVHTLF